MDISTGYFSRVTAQLLLDRAGNSIVDWVFERDLPAQPCLTVTTHEATNTHLFAVQEMSSQLTISHGSLDNLSF